MKIKENLVLRNIANNWMVLPLADPSLDLKGMIKLNETGAILWKILERGGTADDMADALVEGYEVSREEALSDAAAFIKKLTDAGCIEE